MVGALVALVHVAWRQVHPLPDVRLTGNHHNRVDRGSICGAPGRKILRARVGKQFGQSLRALGVGLAGDHLGFLVSSAGRAALSSLHDRPGRWPGKSRRVLSAGRVL